MIKISIAAVIASFALACTHGPEHEVVAFQSVPIAYASSVPATATDLDADQLALVIGAPLDADPNVTTTAALDADAWTEIPATDIVTNATPQKQNRALLVVVTNYDATGRVCIATTTRADNDCGNDTAPTKTCAATPTSGDASPVLAGTQREFLFNAERCIWARASVDNSDATIEVFLR